MYKNLISMYVFQWVYPLIVFNLNRLQQFTFSILACRLLLHLRRLHPLDLPYSEQTFGFLTTLGTESHISE
ncbi:hypothetical protein BDZ94DRAFT_385373 [Collybia nuda]|uniref:Uncharacterized protein n=1 Tax=Collybia nuda TaxID=64659 RepID=A0A9P5YAT7_9AGAR|nr:hypothetical protein BDZ94DRAFT_385373 [Collybia nuda]